MRHRLPPALQSRDFALFTSATFTSSLAQQMVMVAIGWQVYAIHRNPFDLALIGLAEFIPIPLLALPAGQLADRLPRTLIMAASVAGSALVTAGLLVVSIQGAHQLWPFLALAVLSGVTAVVGAPAGRALVPLLVPTELLASGLALRSVASQIANVSGPALGGLLFALSPKIVYGAGTGLFAVSLLSAATMNRSLIPVQRAGDPAPGFRSLLLGIRFIRHTKIILGAISLDLFAVLFGGSVSLLPLFARSILHTGPVGLGVLRSATAVGAVIAGIQLTRKPMGGRAGRKLLVIVGVFGGCMIVFGLSHSFTLSFVALAVSGYVDMFSMNIRSTVVTLAAPNALLGRVSAVENVFISASNELGAFESGLAASLLGAVPAVVIGGGITIALALVWGRLFPPLARVNHLEDVRPVELAIPTGAATS
jgi:MFS family permease